jgi:hypothetical protein
MVPPEAAVLEGLANTESSIGTLKRFTKHHGTDTCAMRPEQSLLAVAVLLVCASAASAQIGVLPQVGDVWEYATREGEGNTLALLRGVKFAQL